MLNSSKLRLSLLGVGLAALAVVLVCVSTTALGGSDEEDRYDVRVLFGATVTQADLDEVASLLRSVDPDADFAVMESFPPQGSARLDAAGGDVCEQVRQKLAGKDYVTGVTCLPASGDAGVDPDEPVGTPR